MKSVTPFFRLWLSSIVLSWLVAGCNNGANDGTDPQTACRIQQYKTAADGTVYTYDAQGRLTQWTFTLSDGFLASTATYTYDADGYLTASMLIRNNRTYLSSGQPGPVQKTTTSTTFSYTGGRLTGYTLQKTPGSSQGIKTIGVFTYNAAGDLTTESATFMNTSDPKLALEPYTFPDGFQQVWSYNNGKLVEYMAKNGEGTSETHPYTIVDGLVTKVEGRSAFEYDSQRRLTKATVYSNGALNSYMVTEWEAGKSARETLPALKGFPSIKALAGPETNLGAVLDYSFIGSVGVQKSYAYFASYKTFGVVQLAKYVYTNQTNSQGLVIKTTTLGTTTYPDEPQQTNTGMTTYTYTGCN